MNQLKNGTLFVAIATIITVILILMTGRDEVVHPEHQEITKEVTLEAEETSLQPSAETTVAVTASEKQEKPVTIVDEEETEDAPKVEVAQQLTATSSTEGTTPEAPKGPFKKASDTANQVASNIDNNKPVAKTTTQHDLLNHLVQPIWMDQKLGDFKSVEKSEVVFKLMPTSPDGLQGNNPTKVVTTKNDNFSPMSIPANYNYQQMPMYNGGYYIAPMPSYLMSSMLPGNATVKSKQKAKTEN